MARPVLGRRESSNRFFLTFFRSQVQVLTNVINPACSEFKEALHELGKICGVKMVLPKSCTFSGSPMEVAPTSECSTDSETRLRIKRIKVRPDDDGQGISRVRFQ